jgi:hypothetical protein
VPLSRQAGALAVGARRLWMACMAQRLRLVMLQRAGLQRTGCNARAAVDGLQRVPVGAGRAG